MIALLPLLLCCLSPETDIRSQEIQTSRDSAQVMPPVPVEEDMFTFVVFGDRTGGPAEGIAVLAQAVQDTNLIEPDLVMTVGDLIQGYNTTEAWMFQAAQFRSVMDQLICPWFPVAGNHDVYWRGEGRPPEEHEGHYEAWFGPLWYAFDHKDCRFIVLYTDEGNPETGVRSFGDPASQRMSDAQKSWLHETLRDAKDMNHVFVFCHHPRWRGGQYGDDWEHVHQLLVDAGNVTAVFAGHVHQLRHDGWRDGIEYLSMATVGGGLPRELPAAGHLHHINLVTVREDHIAQATIPVGGVIDPRALTAEHIAEVDRLRLDGARIAQPIAVDSDGRVDDTTTLKLQAPSGQQVTWTVWPEPMDSRWSIGPDHIHEVLDPGAHVEIPWRFKHDGPLDHLWRPPAVIAQAEVAMGGMAWTLPPQVIAVPVVPGQLEPLELSQSLWCDGRDGAVTIDVGSTGIPKGALTVEAWVRPEQVDGSRGIVAKTEQSEFGLFIEQGVPSFWLFAGDAYAIARSDTPLVTGQWHHLAGVHDGETVRLFVDGQPVGSAVAKGPRRTNTLPLVIGAEVDGAGQPVSHFKGAIDEVRVSSRNRYDVAGFVPQRLHVSDEDTVVLMHLNGRQGPFLVNDADRAPHGTMAGTATFKVSER